MPSSATRQRRRALLREAHRYIGRSYTDPDLDLGDVAAGISASKRQLQRVFREEGGEDFRSYLLRIRMERATVLLTRKKNPLPIHVTARRVGYRQASGLRQAFVRFYGYNPSEVQPAPPQYIGTTEFQGDKELEANGDAEPEAGPKRSSTARAARPGVRPDLGPRH